MYLWRAVDDEGETWTLCSAPAGHKRDPEARPPPSAEPEMITTDGLGSYGAALERLELRHLHRPGRLRLPDLSGAGAFRLRRLTCQHHITMRSIASVQSSRWWRGLVNSTVRPR